jgi:hypothetical protein
MFATLTIAAVLFAQAADTLDTILDRHRESIRRAKAFDELAAAARKTLGEVEKFLQKPPDAESGARGLAIAADICSDLDDLPGAEAHLRKFLETQPSHAKAPMIKTNLGQVLIAAGKDAAAREVFQGIVRDHPEGAFHAKLRIAQSFLCEKRDEDALKSLGDLRSSFKGKPEEWAAVLQTALAHMIIGKPGAGRALLEEAVRSSPASGTVEFAQTVLGTWLWLGKSARPIEGWDLKGKPVKLDLVGGKVTVLYFLSSAFPEFEVESGVMRKLVRRFSGADVNFLAVALDKDKAKLESDLALAGITWPVLNDGNGFKGPVASSYGIESLPMVLLVDRKNVVRYVNPIFGDHAREIGRCVETLLAEKP